MRELDVCTRYGGEEFFIVLPHTPDGEVFEIAERIRIKIRNYLENSFQVTISIGMATISPHITALVDLIKIADTALYASKESGRNRTTRGTLPAEITS